MKQILIIGNATELTLGGGNALFEISPTGEIKPNGVLR